MRQHEISEGLIALGLELESFETRRDGVLVPPGNVEVPAEISTHGDRDRVELLRSGDGRKRFFVATERSEVGARHQSEDVET